MGASHGVGCHSLGVGEGREGASSGVWEAQGFMVHREGVRKRLLLWEEEEERRSSSLHNTHPQDAPGTASGAPRSEIRNPMLQPSGSLEAEYELGTPVCACV